MTALAAATAFGIAIALFAQTAVAGDPGDTGAAKSGAVLVAGLDIGAMLEATQVDDAILAVERGKADVSALPSMPSSQEARVILWDEVRPGAAGVSTNSSAGNLQTNAIVRVQ